MTDKLPCTWREDEDGQWESDCGLSWAFPEGGPADNQMSYCPKCGRQLVAVAWEE
jgi:hypothetical protein